MTIEIDRLTKTYGAQRAVDAITFGVESGAVVGFLGPNGAGKSTTLKIIAGFLPPTEGTVRVGGFDVREQSMQVRRHIGYLPEHNPLYLDMYVHELLRFTADLFGLKQAGARIAEVVEQTGLGPEQHKLIGALSKGYRKRVGLAQALLHDPEVLILDEPTDGLDPLQVLEIRRLVQSFAGRKTILFSSHILGEVEALASRVVIIHRGHIVADTHIGGLGDLVQGAQLVRVEFERPGFDATAVGEWAGVQRVEVVSPTVFHVYVSPEADVRRQLYDACVAQENAILALVRQEATLEDVFRALAGVEV